MARLPVTGGDEGVWGSVLNDFLAVEHNTDGSLKKAADIAAAAQSASDAQTLAASKYAKPSGGIPEVDLDSAVTTKLNTTYKSPVTFSAATASIAATGTDRAYFVRTLTGARMRVVSAPAGSALTVQVQHSTDGTTWSNVGSALTIAAGTTTEASVSFTQGQTIGNLVRLNVTSVGSTTAATGVVVDVLWS